MSVDGPPPEQEADSQLDLFGAAAGQDAPVDVPEVGADPGSSIHIARGALATQRAILARISDWRERVARDPRLLARGVRIVVPSRSLRDQIAAAAVLRHPGLAGVWVQTSFELAFEVVRDGDLPRRVAGGRRLLPVLVRRRARAHEGLRGVLEPLADGFGVAVASVTDLLDAGLEPPLVDGVCEAAAELGQGSERAVALLRVASEVQEELAVSGLAAPAALFQAAADRLRSGHDLGASSIWIHGFADATGAQSELLDALVHACGAELWVDHPPDPAGDGVEPGPVYTARLREHVGAPETPDRSARASEAPELRLVRAPGAEAEVRYVADLLRQRLDAGARPASLGVVARDLAGYRAAIAKHFARLAIPYSGALSSAGRAARRCTAWLELVERGELCPLDRWLEAGEDTGAERLGELRLALHGIGVGRLRDLATLDLDAALGNHASYPLRSLRRLARPSDSEGGDSANPDDAEARPEASQGPVRAARRSVSRAELLGTQERARATLDGLDAAARPGPLEPRLAALRRLTLGSLKLAPEEPGVREILSALVAIENDLPTGFEVESGELGLLLRRALGDAGRMVLGGEGGGVQVLSVTEARAFCFDELFVLGLNRDVFPRVANEDPLLGDEVRGPLLALLPDLPIKARAGDEERYLFAQLCSAAPRVTISWQALGDDGRERVASPLVERLRLGRSLEVATAREVLDGSTGLRPPFEHALRAGLASDRRVHRAALAAADASEARERIAVAREKLLTELDPLPGSAQHARPGAFGGLVGGHSVRDTHESPLHVTRLEGASYCPWRTFLERELGLEPVPDALAELPGTTGLLLGNVVHAALEEIVRDAGGLVRAPLAEALQQGPVAVPWPTAARLTALLQAAAADVARDQGIVMPGFAGHLARRARPYLDAIRALEWDNRGGVLPAVLGAELQAEVDLTPFGLEAQTLGFKADRGDLVDGRTVLTDYKTGKPLSDHAKPERRRAALLEAIASRSKLQAAAYALAPPGGSGEYLFIGPDVLPQHARVSVAGEDAEAVAVFAEAVGLGLSAWQAGVFPPRLEVSPDKPNAACNWCEVADACVRGDSAQHRRQRRWLEIESPGEPDTALARALLGAGP